MESISAGIFAVLAAVLGSLVWRCSRQVRGLESRYSGIIDLDAELKSRRIAFDAGLQTERSQLEETRKATETQLATVEFFFCGTMPCVYYTLGREATIANQIAALGDLRCGSITYTTGRCGKSASCVRQSPQKGP